MVSSGGWFVDMKELKASDAEWVYLGLRYANPESQVAKVSSAPDK